MRADGRGDDRLAGEEDPLADRLADRIGTADLQLRKLEVEMVPPPPAVW
jgi:hypothetical protein